jgi:hypothetical protein
VEFFTHPGKPSNPDLSPEKGNAMRVFSVVALASAMSLSLTLTEPISAIAQSQEASPQSSRVQGYKNPLTGAFHPIDAFVPEAVVSPIAGTITVTLHITLKTAVATGYKVACSGSVIALYSSAGGSTEYTETASAYATVSGTTATCVLTIPHSWQFPAVTATDIETLSGGYDAVIFNPTATGAVASILSRSSSSEFVSLTGANVFATAPSTFSVNVTL